MKEVIYKDFTKFHNNNLINGVPIRITMLNFELNLPSTDYFVDFTEEESKQYRVSPALLTVKTNWNRLLFSNSAQNAIPE